MIDIMNMMAPKIPNQKLEQYERNQSAFEAQFGFDDLQGTALTDVGVGASPDGKRIGFVFVLADGTQFRGALSVAEVRAVLLPLILRALDRAVLHSADINGVNPN